MREALPIAKNLSTGTGRALCPAPPPSTRHPLRLPGARPVFYLLTLLGAACSCSPRPTPAPAPAQIDPAAFNGAAAFEELRLFLAVGPRDSGTPGAQKAAEYLRDRLQALGVRAEINSFADMTPRGRATFHNVIGKIPGAGRGLIILSGHYDTKSGIAGFAGANDGGSSTGLLLALAELLARGPALRPEIWIVFFDGEEAVKSYGPNDGLHGSTRLAAQILQAGRAGDVRALINLDMIGDRDLTITIPRNGHPNLIKAFFDAARAEGVRDKFSLHQFEIGDDHDPFIEAGIPAVDIIDFEYGSAPGRNDFWHTPEDTLDKLAPESLQIVGRVTLRVVNQLAAAEP